MIANIKDSIESKIIRTIPQLILAVDEWRQVGKKITFTNGCFDLLHAGHINYLSEAASLADIFVIGLNSDDSVRRLKGIERPINNEETRSLILASIFFVDAVIIFNEDTPLNLINHLSPDFLIKGSDYALVDIVGASEVKARGGTVKVISFSPGYSSTLIIEKIKKL